jgi:hypothetical protein
MTITAMTGLAMETRVNHMAGQRRGGAQAQRAAEAGVAAAEAAAGAVRVSGVPALQCTHRAAQHHSTRLQPLGDLDGGFAAPVQHRGTARTRCHAALLGLAGFQHQHVGPGLVEAQRRFGHHQRRLALQVDRGVREEALAQRRRRWAGLQLQVGSSPNAWWSKHWG